MKTTLTLLALLAAGVIHLQAQQQPTANEAAWSALLTTAKAAGVANPVAVAAATPEAVGIKDSIMAGTTITRTEIWIIADVTKATGGEAAYQAAFRAIAASGKTGDGIVFARAAAKFWDKDMAGWTSEMLAARPDLAGNLAMTLNATPAFKAEVWEALKTRSAHGWSCRNFFKAYRSTLPKTAQIEATQKQKDLVLAIPTRDAAANAWLAEISADLVALQLDQ
jgi:hypothetical protein